MKRAFESVRAMNRRDWAVTAITAVLAMTVLANRATNGQVERNAQAVMSPEFAYASSPAGIAMAAMQRLADGVRDMYLRPLKEGGLAVLPTELRQGNTSTYGVTVEGVDTSLAYKVAIGHFQTDALYDVEATFVSLPGHIPVATAVAFTTSEVGTPNEAAMYTQTMTAVGGAVGTSIDLSARFGTSNGVQVDGWQAHAQVGYPKAVPDATGTFCATPEAVRAFVEEATIVLGDARAQNALQPPLALQSLGVATAH